MIEIDPNDQMEHFHEGADGFDTLKIWGIHSDLFPILFAIVLSVSVVGIAYIKGLGQGFYELILERGWTQFLTIFLFFLAIGHSITKKTYQVREGKALIKLDPIVSDLLVDAKHKEFQGFEFALKLITPYRKSIAGSFFLNLLSFFKEGKPSREEIFKLAYQERDLALDKLEIYDGALKSIMWLLPLTGFLGTVLGMGATIGGLAEQLPKGTIDFQSLGPTVAGLSVAFDTTLLALVFLMPLKGVELYLNRKDAFLIEEMDALLGSGFLRQVDLGKLAQHSHQVSAQDEMLQRFVDQLRSANDRFQEMFHAFDRLQHSFTDQLKQQVAESKALIEQMKQSTQGLNVQQFHELNKNMAILSQLHQQVLPALYQESQQQSQTLGQLQYQLHHIQEDLAQPMIVSRSVSQRK